MSNQSNFGPIAYFIGVTTRQSASLAMWPGWMAILGRPAVRLEGVDLPLHAEPGAYRQIVEQIKHEPDCLGALVTSHKIDLFAACHDLFDELDPHARRCAELSSISKRSDRLLGHATDPIAGGRTLRAMLGDGYFERSGGHVLMLGGGGAAAALSLYLAQAAAGNRPERLVLVDVDQARLDRLQHMLAVLSTDVQVEYVLNSDPAVNDRFMAALPEGSLVVNATGMGKDRPGSPVTDGAYFPREGVAWELNYRGALDFLRQARRQAGSRTLAVHDGWLYFLHGWSCVVEHLLDVTIDEQTLVRLTAVAEAVRGG